MIAPCYATSEAVQAAGAVDSHAPAQDPSRIPAQPREADLLDRMFWTTRETAFIARVSVRSLWRELSNPRSRFPRPHRVGARNLFSRDAVLAHLGRKTAASN